MNSSTSQSQSSIHQEVALSRNLSPFTITMIGIGGMIGAGIFVLTGLAAGVAGSALILAFLLNGMITLLTGMAYAELGSAFPKAGAGYLWVKEGLGDTQGFLAGWMNWFATIVAGSLYALGFGRFFTEFWIMAGLPTFGLSIETMTLIFMTLIIVIFTALNYRGASETGAVGNIITLAKIAILGLFVIFGLMAMLRADVWQDRFTTEFLPNGVWSLIVAMGLTFIAFEGYEIIAQTSEEVINPRRNVPRAIFTAIGVVVVIYVLVGITAIGAVQPPKGVPVYAYLGEKGEIAIVEVARQVFPLGAGAVILLVSGLVSTMSALNATTYSSSRVSFAMGRDHNLPSIFASVHARRHTPYWAIICSGALMLLIAWILPIESVAAAAGIMFLLLFLQVNVALMMLRHKMPDLPRGFKIPWYPAIPVLALVANSILAISLFTFSTSAWITALIWVVIGLLTYLVYFSKVEAMERPKEILMEEVLVSRDYSVMVPVATQEQAMILGQIGAIVASANGGEVLAVHVVNVPPHLTLGEGRLFLKEGRSYLETVIHRAKGYDVPVHTVIRLGRNVAEAVRKTVVENASDLIVLGWPGYTNTAGRLFGSVIDPIVENPPTTLAVVRYRQRRPVRRILVPVGGGPNSRLAAKMAADMALSGEEGPGLVTLMYTVPIGAHNGDMVRAEQAFQAAMVGLSYEGIEKRIVEGDNLVDSILGVAEGNDGYKALLTQEDQEDGGEYDLIVIGATREPLFKRLRFGNVSEQVADRAHITVVMVKRRSSALHSFLRQTVLEPTSNQVS